MKSVLVAILAVTHDGVAGDWQVPVMGEEASTAVRVT